MGNLFRAFFFKLKKDLTFRIALFIGVAMAVFMTLAFLLIDKLRLFLWNRISHS